MIYGRGRGIGRTPLRARTKKHCRAVHVIEGGVPHRLVAFWGRLNFQCFVRKFMNEHFEFYLVECAIFLCIHGLDPLPSLEVQHHHDTDCDQRYKENFH
jgi:hypothetical protein